jgi:hypothetical protein
MSPYVSDENKGTHILPAVLAIANDRSWRVRWSLANRLHEVLGAVDAAAISTVGSASLSNVFESLLNDSEPEVCCSELLWL